MRCDLRLRMTAAAARRAGTADAAALAAEEEDWSGMDHEGSEEEALAEAMPLQ